MLENDDPYSTFAVFLRPEGSKMRAKCSQNVPKRAEQAEKREKGAERREEVHSRAAWERSGEHFCLAEALRRRLGGAPGAKKTKTVPGR